MSSEKEAKDTKEEAKDPASQARELEAKLKLNKILLMVAIGLFAFVLCVLGAGFGVIYVKVSALANAPTDEINEKLEKITTELNTLKTLRGNEVTSITAFDQKIQALQAQHDSADTAAMKQVLLDREKDYQHLVETLSSGTESLAGMVAGSRSWVDFYKSEMLTLKEHSIRRSSSIESTLSNAQANMQAVTNSTPAEKPADKKEPESPDNTAHKTTDSH